MISSPCTGLCRLDPASDECLGCARTRSEVALWSKASDDVRAKIWAELPARRARLGLQRLPWRVDAGSDSST